MWRTMAGDRRWRLLLHSSSPAAMQAITLEPLTLLRPVDPADTTLAEQVCQVANDIDQHGKLKGKRLTDAVDALNALGGTWELAP